MTGRKTLGQARAELEAALGGGPEGGGEVAESLRRFLADRASEGGTPGPAPQRAGSAAVAPGDAENNLGGPVR